MKTWFGARSGGGGGEAFEPQPQLPPDPQEDFATGAGSAVGVEQLPVLHPPEVEVFVLQQPMMKFPVYRDRSNAKRSSLNQLVPKLRLGMQSLELRSEEPTASIAIVPIF